MTNFYNTDHDPAVLQDIIEKQRKVFDRLDEREVAIFIAHTEYGKSAADIAYQTVTRSVKNVKKVINYVREELAHELEELSRL